MKFFARVGVTLKEISINFVNFRADLLRQRVFCMMYVGMANVIELMSVRRPTREKVWAFQDGILSRSLSMMKLYALLSLLL